MVSVRLSAALPNLIAKALGLSNTDLVDESFKVMLAIALSNAVVFHKDE